jgi:Ser/Thr protein kinase RdoA (MazF antagonist)
LAGDVYGLHGEVRMLPGEYDHNFHIVTDEGPGFVLKMMHPARERAVLQLQVAALSHLARRAADVGPRVRETRHGEALTVQDVAQGPPRLVWMVGYRPGSTLAEARPRSLSSTGPWRLTRPRSFRPCPVCAGASSTGTPTTTTSSWVRPAPDRGRSWTSSTSTTCTAAWWRPSPPWPQPIALLGARDPLAAAARVVAGYHAAFPLREDEIARLWPLIVMRLTVSVTNSAASKRSRPRRGLPHRLRGCRVVRPGRFERPTYRFVARPRRKPGGVKGR